MKEIDREHLARARAKTFKNSDALELLRDEYPYDAPNAHAAKDENDEAREAQVALAAIQAARETVPRFAIGPHPDELVHKRALQIPDEILDPLFVHAHENLSPDATAEVDKPCLRNVRVVDEDPRPQRKHPEATSSFAHDDASDLELAFANPDAVANLYIETREKLGPHESAAILDERVFVSRTHELDLPVIREALLDGAKLHQRRGLALLIIAPRHRRRLDRARRPEDTVLLELFLDDGRRVIGVSAVAIYKDVRCGETLRLFHERGADALNDRAECHHRCNTHGDTEKEEDEPAPRSAHLAPRHT